MQERSWTARASVALALALSGPGGATALCATPVSAGSHVVAANDGRTLALQDGRVVILAGLDVPGTVGNVAPEQHAQDFLQQRVVGRNIALHGRINKDRYGRIPAFVTLEDSSLEGFVQDAMVAQGLGRVAARVGVPGCVAGLRAAERQARSAKRGLWRDAAFAVLRADDPPTVSAVRGQTALVEGRVLSVRESGGTVYINFGRRWSEDFTATVAKRRERALAAAGLNIRGLERRTVIVRGIVEERGGPWIEVTEAEQIETVGN